MIISLFIMTLFMGQFDLINSKQCKKISNCICDFDDGSGMIDLSALGKTDGTPLFKDLPSTTDAYLYSYNPCGSFTESTCVDVASCQYSPYYLIGYDIGVPDKVSFNYDGLNVVANYASQDGTRQSFVTLVCDPGATTPSLDVTGETATTQYYMTLTASAACLVPSTFDSSDMTGISTGSVLLIVFFSLLVVYAVAGFAFQKFKRGASGKELVPNLEVWTLVPALIRDGCKFTIDTVLRRRSEYSKL